VTGVYVSSSAWSADFKQYMAANNGGSATLGYKVPTRGQQTKPLPWANLDRVSVTFSDDVRVDAADLRVTGINVASYALDPAAFTYDAATHTATWTLAGGSKFGTDRILFDLDADGTAADGNDGVRAASADATFLDGDWIPPVDELPNGWAGDVFPSGDGIPGQDFLYRVNVLPGDTVLPVGQVLAVDFSEVKKRFFRSTTDPGPFGSATYTVFYDINGDGTILADDFSEVKKHFFDTLPAGQPQQTAPTTVTAVFASESLFALTRRRTAARPSLRGLLG